MGQESLRFSVVQYWFGMGVQLATPYILLLEKNRQLVRTNSANENTVQEILNY